MSPELLDSYSLVHWKQKLRNVALSLKTAQHHKASALQHEKLEEKKNITNGPFWPFYLTVQIHPLQFVTNKHAACSDNSLRLKY